MQAVLSEVLTDGWGYEWTELALQETTQGNTAPIAFGLAAMGLPTWAGFGLVSLFLLVSAVVTGLLTKKNASTIKGPDLSMAELRKTQEILAPSKPVE
jgi:hypothetical protein